MPGSEMTPWPDDVRVVTEIRRRHPSDLATRNLPAVNRRLGFILDQRRTLPRQKDPHRVIARRKHTPARPAIIMISEDQPHIAAHDQAPKLGNTSRVRALRKVAQNPEPIRGTHTLVDPPEQSLVHPRHRLRGNPRPSRPARPPFGTLVCLIRREKLIAIGVRKDVRMIEVEIGREVVHAPE